MMGSHGAWQHFLLVEGGTITIAVSVTFTPTPLPPPPSTAATATRLDHPREITDRTHEAEDRS